MGILYALFIVLVNREHASRLVAQGAGRETMAEVGGSKEDLTMHQFKATGGMGDPEHCQMHQAYL